MRSPGWRAGRGRSSRQKRLCRHGTMAPPRPRSALARRGGLDVPAIPGERKIETNLAVPLSPCPLCRPSRDNGTALYRLACQLDLEGIVAKRADSPYEDVLTCGIGSKSRIPPSAKRKGGRICSSEQACNRCHSQIACAGIWAVL